VLGRDAFARVGDHEGRRPLQCQEVQVPQRLDDYFEVTCDHKQFEVVRKALEDANIPTESAETSYIPATYVDLDVDSGKKMLKLRDFLDENDDAQNVYANDNIPEEALAD